MKCKKCGCELVNEWEIEHGICAGCDYNAEHGTISSPRDGGLKYIRQLSVCRTISIILALISAVIGFFGGTVGTIAGIIGSFGFAGMSVIFGALRKILQRM